MEKLNDITVGSSTRVLSSWSASVSNYDILVSCRLGLPFLGISRSLRECCPFLNALKRIHGSQDILNDHVLLASGVLSHILAPRHLVHLELPLKLTIELGDTLLNQHSDILQTAKFSVKSVDEYDFLGVDSILAACSNLTYFAMHTGGSFHHKDNKSQIWSAEDIDAIPILPWTCSLEALALTGMLPVCHRDDDAAKGFSKSDRNDSRGAS